MRSILLTSTAPFVATADQPQQPAAQAAKRPRSSQREPKRALRQQHFSPSDTGDDDAGDEDDPPSPPAAKSYLTAKQLRRRYGNRSHMWIERRLRGDPTFPRPVYFGRFRFWALDELERWERAAVVARDRTPREAA